MTMITPKEVRMLSDTQEPVLTDAVGQPAVPALVSKLAHIEGQLAVLSQQLCRVYELVAAKVVVKEFYSTTEAAQMLNRRPYTVREWCRHGRVNAVKTHAGRGEDEEWRISHEELTRIQNQGLLPLSKY